ncbi:hypothetical protein JTE90_028691 [Oedothorax gibbosus]|uniref:Uncharacterized protein n=1 Tax=Oedothorax gibbosus TaxID=931172 RepID=A0AAV6U0A1_9ARAC|nr:hypothetical protein JTE90_028691 [Oedothorax gibbosus]
MGLASSVALDNTSLDPKLLLAAALIILPSFNYGLIPFRKIGILYHLEDLPIDEKITQDVKFGPPLELESLVLQHLSLSCPFSPVI